MAIEPIVETVADGATEAISFPLRAYKGKRLKSMYIRAYTSNSRLYGKLGFLYKDDLNFYMLADGWLGSSSAQTGQTLTALFDQVISDYPTDIKAYAVFINNTGEDVRCELGVDFE